MKLEDSVGGTPMFLCKSQMELMEACGITCWELHIPAGTSMVQLTLLPYLWELYAAVLLPPRYTFHKVLQPALPQPGLSSVKHLVENRSEHVPRLYDHVCHNLCGWGFQKRFCGLFSGDALGKTNAFGLCEPVCHSVFTCMFSRYGNAREPGIVCSNQLPFFGMLRHLKGEFPDPRTHDSFAHHIAETSLKSMQRHLDPPAANLPIHSSSWAYQAYQVTVTRYV